MGIKTYQARWILPIATPPIENGWVSIENNRILDLGSAKSSPGDAIDLGDVAIFPGLVNAHTHLEFSSLDGPIGDQGTRLCDWIGQIVQHRVANDSQRSVTDAIVQGLRSSHLFGTALLCDIASTPFPSNLQTEFEGTTKSDSPNDRPTTIWMPEVLGLTSPRWSSKLEQAEQFIDADKPFTGEMVGICPHAPYSTPRLVVEKCVDISKRRQVPLAMHVAESVEERQLIEQGTGPFAERLRQIQAYDESLFPWGAEATLDLLRLLAQAHRALIIHGNDLRPAEIAYLSARPNLSVVYCPRTHAFFGHSPHPVGTLLDAGIRVALGTDSLASNPDLSIWREVQWLLNHRQDLYWQTVLSLATKCGAEALGMRDHGVISPGSRAQLLVIRSSATSEDRLAEDLVSATPEWLTR